jgi:nicotinate-nucleotide adenylyltransferase
MIGIFGGTFDPVHYGHLRSALEVKEVFGLNEVRFIPSAKPPHRQAPKASAAMRLAMLKLAIESQPGFVADTREIERDGPSYMILTLESLRRDFPRQALLLFIGGDAFNHLTGWHQWQRLFDYAHVVILKRPGYALPPLDDFYKLRLVENKESLACAVSGSLYFQEITQLDISATAIRAMLSNSRDPRYLLPDVVLNYIRQHHLYLSTD